MNTRKHHLLFIPILIILVLISIVTMVPSVLALSYTDYYDSYYDMVKSNYDNYNDSLWSLGNGIVKGDYYSYKICNDDTIHQIIYPYHCYIISLEFVTILESYKGTVWVVQGNFSTPDVTQQMIFLIGMDTFEVSTDMLHKELGASLEDTIFSLSKYGEKSLSIGTVWDEIDSYFTNKIPLEIKNKQTIQIFTPSNYSSNYSSNYTNIETSVLSYDVVVPSNTYLHESFPFPLKAETYSPFIIYPHPKEEYYFELIDYQSGYQSGYQLGYQLDSIPILMGD